MARPPRFDVEPLHQRDSAVPGPIAGAGLTLRILQATQ